MNSLAESDINRILASYVPDLIIDRFTSDLPQPLVANVVEQSGVLLFADISGFTVLTERLAQRGPIGAELVGNILNDYFGKLIDHVVGYGGDVIKFAGDAVLALWHSQDLGDATQRVAECSLAIQQSLDGYTAEQDSQLSLRIGIAAGKISVVHVGGVYGRWEFLIAGEALAQVSMAVHRAQPGNIVLSPETWVYLGKDAQGRAVGDDYRILEQVTASHSPRPMTNRVASGKAESAVRSYIPGAVLAPLDAGHSGWLAELRRVTVLFINLKDINHETPLERTQQVISELQTSLYRYRSISIYR